MPVTKLGLFLRETKAIVTAILQTYIERIKDSGLFFVLRIGVFIAMKGVLPGHMVEQTALNS